MRKIIILISFALLIALGISAYSQEPSPRPAKITNEQQKKTSPKQTESKANQQISNEISTAIKINPTQSPDPEKENNPKHGNNETADNWPLSNILLVIFNGLLAIFTFCLWKSTDKMWKSTKETADAAKRSSDLAREEFIATHRPKLRVHSVFWGNDDTGSHIQCSVDNIGGSAAIIKEVSMELKILGDMRPIPIPLAYGKLKLVEKTIQSGCSDTERYLPDWEIKIPPLADRNSIYFFGYINYWDTVGNIRRVAFCRRYMVETERFVTVQDDNCEYNY